MNTRTPASLIGKCFVSLALVGTASVTQAKGPRDVVVEGQRIDPELQRTVSYADLNLALRTHQRLLSRRIYRTADDLCFDLNGMYSVDCTVDAIHSTDDQVAAAIARAERQMAGLPVGPATTISMVINAR